MTVLMRLQGGPLDGEQQIVEMLPTTPGAQLFFNIPNYQTFDPSAPTETVIGVGLQAYYSLVGPGAGPGTGDTWTSSWIFSFTGEAYVPTPPPLYPSGGPPTPPPLVWIMMSATTTLVPDSLPITTSSAVVLVGESAIDVEALVTSFQYGVVAMTGESVLTTQFDWQPQVAMTGNTAMTVDPAAAVLSATAGLSVVVV
jgi:hypothetical protein